MNKKYDFITIDFETANNNNNSACSLGLCMVNGTEIVDKQYYLIKPPTEHFRHEQTEIHGLSYDDVKNEPYFNVIWKKISNLFNGDSIIIAHNAQFDMSVLYKTLEYYNIDFPNFNYIDSISIARNVLSADGNSLVDCANAAGVTIDNHHNALSDATTAALIVIESIKKKSENDLLSLLNKYYMLHKKIHSFSDLKPNSQIKSGNFTKVKISELVAATTEFNTNHPLYGKNCVVTGEFTSFGRKEAMQRLVDVGANVKSSVSGVTDYLFVGVQDEKLVGEDGLSTKEEKAYQLIERGKNIKIVKEEGFIKLLNGDC